MKILITEDEEAMMEMAVAILGLLAGKTDDPPEIIQKPNADEGLDYFLKHYKDIIGCIFDVNAPRSVLTGLNLLRIVKELNSDTPVIIMSGIPANETEAVQNKADGFIAKPFPLDKFMEVIKKVFPKS